MKTLLATEFIVRIDELAVCFHTNITGKSVFSIVPDDEATTFSDPTEADQMARDHGLRWGQYKIEPLSPERGLQAASTPDGSRAPDALNAAVTNQKSQIANRK